MSTPAVDGKALVNALYLSALLAGLTIDCAYRVTFSQHMYKYTLTLVDVASRYKEAKPLSTKETTFIAWWKEANRCHQKTVGTAQLFSNCQPPF